MQLSQSDFTYISAEEGYRCEVRGCPARATWEREYPHQWSTDRDADDDSEYFLCHSHYEDLAND
jgi:hypothetical protein